MTLRRPANPRIWNSAPSLLVTIPLAGFAFRLDERIVVYKGALFERDRLLNAFEYAHGSADRYLDAGNFRPLGRFIEGLLTGFVFEAGEATHLPPHVVMGLFRLLAVFILACVCVRIVTALVRSSGFGSDSPAPVLYPLVLGIVLVANGRSGPLVHYSFLFIGAVSFIFLVALATARDVDMQPRSMRWHEPAAMVVLGAAAAMYYDLVYIAPPLAAAFVAARAAASGMPLSELPRTAAVRRWLALSFGFLAVFIPTRIEIADRCRQGSCYVGSDITFAPELIEVLPVRALSGTPPAGWAVVRRVAATHGPGFGMGEFLDNALLVLLLVGVVAVTLLPAAGVIRSRPRQSAPAVGDDRPGVTSTPASSGGARLGIVIGLFGLTTVILSSLLVSLAGWIQTSRIDHGWRETVLTQTGWSFVIIGVTVLILGSFRSADRDPARRIVAAGVAVILGVGLASTLVANARLTQVDRHSPSAFAAGLISSATVSIDSTGRGNPIRCGLIDMHSSLEPEASWLQGPILRKELDSLMLARHGRPFCAPVTESSPGGWSCVAAPPCTAPPR